MARYAAADRRRQSWASDPPLPPQCVPAAVLCKALKHALAERRRGHVEDYGYHPCTAFEASDIQSYGKLRDLSLPRRSTHHTTENEVFESEADYLSEESSPEGRDQKYDTLPVKGRRARAKGYAPSSLSTFQNASHWRARPNEDVDRQLHNSRNNERLHHRRPSFFLPPLRPAGVPSVGLHSRPGGFSNGGHENVLLETNSNNGAQWDQVEDGGNAIAEGTDTASCALQSYSNRKQQRCASQSKHVNARTQASLPNQQSSPKHSTGPPPPYYSEGKSTAPPHTRSSKRQDFGDTLQREDNRRRLHRNEVRGGYHGCYPTEGPPLHKREYEAPGRAARTDQQLLSRQKTSCSSSSVSVSDEDSDCNLSGAPAQEEFSDACSPATLSRDLSPRLRTEQLNELRERASGEIQGITGKNRKIPKQRLYNKNEAQDSPRGEDEKTSCYSVEKSDNKFDIEKSSYWYRDKRGELTEACAGRALKQTLSRRAPFYTTNPQGCNSLQRNGDFHVTNRRGVVPEFVVFITNPLIDGAEFVRFVLSGISTYGEKAGKPLADRIDLLTREELLGSDGAAPRTNLLKKRVNPNTSELDPGSFRTFLHRAIRSCTRDAIVFQGIPETFHECQILSSALGRPHSVIIMTLCPREMLRRYQVIENTRPNEAKDLSQKLFLFEQAVPDIVRFYQSRTAIEVMDYSKKSVADHALDLRSRLTQWRIPAGTPSFPEAHFNSCVPFPSYVPMDHAMTAI